MDEFKAELLRLFRVAGIPLSEAQAGQMQAHYACMLRENAKYNLTGITQPGEAALKHFLDSAGAVELLPKGARVIDVGSGAGFPILPLKVLRPDIQAFALESNAKKCGFIELAAGETGVEVTVLNGRAEELAQAAEWREGFDVCVSRAVAALPLLMELCAGLVAAPGGSFLAYKGSTAGEEAKAAQKAAAALHLELAGQHSLPVEGYAHTVLAYRKTGMLAAKYPRAYAQMKKRLL